MGQIKQIAITCLAFAGLNFTMSTQISATPGPGDIGARLVKNSDKVRFTVITKKGYYSYDINRSWRATPLKGFSSVYMKFVLVPRGGNAGQQFAGTMTIGGYQTSEPQARKAIAEIGRSYRKQPVRIIRFHGWKVFMQRATEMCAECKILDARKKVADVEIGIRLSYPVSSLRGPHSDKNLEKNFYALLRSVSGKYGPYQPRPDEDFR